MKRKLPWKNSTNCLKNRQEERDKRLGIRDKWFMSNEEPEIVNFAEPSYIYSVYSIFKITII